MWLRLRRHGPAFLKLERMFTNSIQRERAERSEGEVNCAGRDGPVVCHVVQGGAGRGEGVPFRLRWLPACPAPTGDAG